MLWYCNCRYAMYRLYGYGGHNVLLVMQKVLQQSYVRLCASRGCIYKPALQCRNSRRDPFKEIVLSEPSQQPHTCVWAMCILNLWLPTYAWRPLTAFGLYKQRQELKLALHWHDLHRADERVPHTLVRGYWESYWKNLMQKLPCASGSRFACCVEQHA